MTTALITGATSGLGAEFARQLAGLGHDLVIVARNTERLEAEAAELHATHGVQVEVLSADLSDRAQLQRVADRLADTQRPVDILVNNAGYGLKGRFLQNDIADEEALFDVLSRAVMVLSHAAALAMKERGHGAIINVASVAAFIASGTYSANKAFATVFTEGLASELAGTGVTATVVCPGFVHTEFHERAGLKMDSTPSWMWLDAPSVVREAIADAKLGKAVSVPGKQYKAIVAALRVAPRSLIRSRGTAAHRPGHKRKQ